MNLKNRIEHRFRNKVLCCATCKWFQSNNDIVGSTLTCHKYASCNYTGLRDKKYEFINDEKWTAKHNNSYYHWELPDDRKIEKYLLEDELFDI